MKEQCCAGIVSFLILGTGEEDKEDKEVSVPSGSLYSAACTKQQSHQELKCGVNDGKKKIISRANTNHPEPPWPHLQTVQKCTALFDSSVRKCRNSASHPGSKVLLSRNQLPD